MRKLTHLALLTSALAACAPSSDLTEAESPEPIGEATFAVTVGEAVTAGCSTASVKGLSEQIIEQADCLEPGSFTLVPAQPNLTLGSTVVAYLELPARDSLVVALKANTSKTMQVNSMLRTIAQQYLLYQWYLNGQCGISLAAKPGNSNHETGLALDINDNVGWKSALESNGFKWLGSSDPVHFDYVGPGAVSHKATNVKAFQMLWNLNHPSDLIAEDGAYGPMTEARLKQSPTGGFPLGPSCEPPPAKVPDIYPAVAIEGASDVFTDGSSAGTVDVFEKEPHAIRLLVTNNGTAAASNVDVAVSFDGFTGSDYLIESDWTHPGTFAENDANQAAANPPHQSALPSEASFTLNALSPNETKRITVYASDAGYSIGTAKASRVRFWVKDVPSYYHQDQYDGAATNVDSSQTFGDRLQAPLSVDVFSHTRWEFNSDTREGWSAVGPVALTANAPNKALHLAVSGDESAAAGPVTAFSAASYDAVALRARRSGGSGPAGLFFMTEAEPQPSGDKSVAFELPDDDAFHSVVLNLGSNPKWTGTIVGLRLQPFTSGSGVVELDYVRADAWGSSSGGGGAGGAGGGPPLGGGGTGEGGSAQGGAGQGGAIIDEGPDGTAGSGGAGAGEPVGQSADADEVGADAGCSLGMGRAAGSIRGLGLALLMLVAARRRRRSC
jgi:hypothetical protein